MAEITIKSIKNIALLEFDIPRRGVNVLTGSNGAGKTTLMTCMERLANEDAFQKYFKSSTNIQFDSFAGGEIIYSFNNLSVTYKYMDNQWQAEPIVNVSVLQNIGFEEVLFIASNDDRFYIQDQELNTRHIIAAPRYLKDGMNQIFQTDKFEELRRIKIEGEGLEHRRNYAFILIANSKDDHYVYYSEKNFSLGELLILNALSQLSSVRNGSLVLIDEVELALHPKVQIKFLQFLQKIATERNISIIISTHSVSLIKAAPKLIHLEKDESTGKTIVKYDCYPAIALQDIAFEDDVQADFVFFVEDNNAKAFLGNLIEYYYQIIVPNDRKPLYKILPVGGWPETVKFLVNSIATLFPKNIRSFAFLDQDAFIDLNYIQNNPNRSESQQEIINLYNRHSKKIKFLPITPELGVVNQLNNAPHRQVQPFRQFFNLAIDLSELIYNENNRNLIYSPNPRTAAKKRFDFYMEAITQLGGWDKRRSLSMLFQYYIEQYAPENTVLIQELLGPVFK